MGHGYKSGAGGGASLNFKVLTYDAEADLLEAKPKENTIGVISINPMTSYIFSSTEPEEPVDGMVWIRVGTSSQVEFSATKKNPIMVYPLAAKQYVDGAWVSVTAMSFQGGEWVSWRSGQLYKNGNELENITGGWQTRAWAISGSGTYTSAKEPTVTKEKDCMIVTLSGVTGSGVLETVNDIDVSEYSTLYIDCVLERGGNLAHALFNLTDRNGKYTSTSDVVSVDLDPVTTRTTIAVDISNVNTAVDVVFVLYCQNNQSAKLTIYGVELE